MHWQATQFRRLLPRLIELHDLVHPDLPWDLEGVRVLHVSDLHVRGYSPRSRRFEEVVDAIGSVEADVIVWTGDFMDAPGQERGAIETLRALGEHVRTSGGRGSGAAASCVGVFGNHDTARLRREVSGAIPWIRFAENRVVDVQVRGKAQRVLGLSSPEDVVGAMLNEAAGASVPFLALAHHSTCLISCAEVGVGIVCAGHTHGGQVRLGRTLVPHTSSDVPGHMASGVLRLRSTMMAVSRGVGDGVIEGLRINCPAQMPLYTLRRGAWAKAERVGVSEDVRGGGSFEAIQRLKSW